MTEIKMISSSPPPQFEEMPAPQINMTPETLAVVEQICTICGEIAPEDDKHHLHYGGICCYSCRAFFRRAHQSTKRPNFECKSGGTCQITVKNRRKCQKCRYEKCLNIGMDPRWVLTSDQKKVRFRNYLKKRVVEQQHDSSSTHNNPITENHHNIYHHPSATTSSELKLDSAIRWPTACDGPQLPKLMLRPNHPLILNLNPPIIQSRNELPVQSSTNMMERNPQQPFYLEKNLVQHSDVNNVRRVHQRVCNTLRNNTTISSHHGHSLHSTTSYLPQLPPLTRLTTPYQHVPTRNSLQKYQSDDQIPPTNENESLQQVPSRNSQNITEDEMLYDDSSSNPERCSSSSSMASQALTDQVQISSILNVFILTMADNCNQAFRDQLIALHQGQISPSQLNLDSWTYHLINLVGAFTRFAKDIPLFQSLCPEDQTCLVTNNAFLFVQYLLGRYFSSWTGMDQLLWIINMPVTCIEDIAQLQVVSFDEFNRGIQMIGNTSLRNQYKECISELGLHFHHPHFYLGLVAYCLLFHSNSEMNLRESSRIKKIFEEAERLIQVGTHKLTEDIGVQRMGPLLKTLKAMEKICTASNIYNRAGYSTEQVSQSLVSKSVYFAYSNAEENWLTKQLNTFETSFQSVEMPGSWINESLHIFEHHLDIPDHFRIMAMKGMVERFQRALCNLSEYNTLPDTLQKEIWQYNMMNCMALFFVNMESQSTGSAQIQIVVEGCGSREKSKGKMPDFPKGPAVKIDKVFKHHVTPEEQEKYYKAFFNVASLVNDDFSCKLLSLIMLTDVAAPLKSPLTAPLMNLRATFMKCLKRRNGDNLEFVGKFERAIKGISEIAMVMPLMMSANID